MYLKKTYIYRDHIEVRKYHTSKYGVKGEKRQKKTVPSDELRRKNNERVAKEKLTRLLINNFDEGDYHMVLTYSDDYKPDVDSSKRILQNFLRAMKREYKKRGMELKYIITTEWKNRRIHHHVVINGCGDFARIINRLWVYGGKHLTPLYPDGDYDGLAEYLVKETSKTFRENGTYRQRYTCSRNLKKPVEKVEIIKSNEWRKEPEVGPRLREEGYMLDINTLYTGIDMWGYAFQHYTLKRKGERNERHECRRISERVQGT